MKQTEKSTEDSLRISKLEHDLEATRSLIRDLQRELQRERESRQKMVVELVEKERHRANTTIQAVVDKERLRANTVINRELERLRGQVAEGFSDRNPKRYQPFSRRLSSEDERLLLENWSERLGLELRVQQIRYAEYRLNHIEDLCQGRFAGRIQDIVLRALVGAACSTDEFRMLEIGTLFGIGAISLWDLWSGTFPSVHLTLIDPLKGYYSQSDRDPITGIPVSPEVLLRNLELAGVPPGSVDLLRGLSSDPEVLERARGSQYDLILLDGDRSFEGVARDFRSYRELLRVGGFLIFDDYGHPGWPGVKEAVDQLAFSCKDLEKVGVEWNTAVFRRIR